MILTHKMPLGRSFWMFLLLAALSWTTAASYAQATPVYSPELPAGITTIEAAREDLARLLEKRSETMLIIYHGMAAPSPDSQEAWARVYQAYPQIKNIMVAKVSPKNDIWIYTAGVTVLPDRIDLPLQPLFYEDLSGFDIAVENGSVVMSGNIKLRLSVGAMADAQRIADDLFFIRQHITPHWQEKEAAFQEKAAAYRALKVKPPMSEEQRKFVVQANAFNERKEYARAIDLYQKATEVDPVSYPPAYFNLALLSAQTQRFKTAVRYMKQYLLLVPEAKDARRAQDKIYEWEAMAAN